MSLRSGFGPDGAAELNRWTAVLRPARDGIALVCVGFAFFHLLGLTGLGADAYAYWVNDPSQPYRVATPGAEHAYLYSPAFTQALGPLHGVPWEDFGFVFILALTVALVWQAGLWTAPVFIAFPLIALDIIWGNIHILLAAAIVAGFRWPAAWSFVLLTKVTPGVGLLWFAARREWRSLGIAIGATALIVGVSFIAGPDVWWRWFDVLAVSAGGLEPRDTIPVPLSVRLVAAALIVVWGARTNRRWTVIVASTIALPVLWFNGLATLVGVIPLIPAIQALSPAGRFLNASPSEVSSAPQPAVGL